MCKASLPILGKSEDIYETLTEFSPLFSNIINESISLGENVYSASTDLLPVPDIPSQLMLMDKLSLINYQNVLLVMLLSLLLKLLIPVI